MIITISGPTGSGKSTVGRMLAKRLGYRFLSAGDMRGEIALGMGMTIDELNDIGKKEIWTDKRVDDRIRRLGETGDGLVIDGWAAFHFIPRSFKVFLDVGLEEGAGRVFRDQRPDEKRAASLGEAVEMARKRIEETRERYRKHYGFDFMDKGNYDLVIDTTRMSPEKVVGMILEAVEAAGNAGSGAGGPRKGSKQ
jgi:cytidylate kinase